MASATKGHTSGRSVILAHLAIALCRCRKIPARYGTGYLSDIGKHLPHPPWDFAARMEMFLAGECDMFEPRNNTPRFASPLIAHDRDASDVPLAQTFRSERFDGMQGLDG